MKIGKLNANICPIKMYTTGWTAHAVIKTNKYECMHLVISVPHIFPPTFSGTRFSLESITHIRYDSTGKVVETLLATESDKGKQVCLLL